MSGEQRRAAYSEAMRQMATALHGQFCDADIELVGGWDEAVCRFVVEQFMALPGELHSAVLATLALEPADWPSVERWRRRPTHASTEQMVTYRRADGSDVDGHTWVIGDEWFECEDEPVEIVRETWVLAERTRYWRMPDLVWGSCDVEDHGLCDEDGVEWQRVDETWLVVCERHRTPAGEA